ncbi:MAG: hypothetical protein QXD43_03145 [Candidatus Aenigmatarchaeota archaeon]
MNIIINNKIDRQLKKAVTIIPQTHLILQEFLALVANIKPVILHALSLEEIHLIKKYFPEIKIAFIDKNTSNNMFQKEFLSCALSKNALLSQKALNTYWGTDNTVVQSMGNLLGYPKCCVDNYVKYFELHRQWDSVFITYKTYERSQKFNFLVNNLLNFNTRVNNENFDNMLNYQSMNKNFPLWYYQFIFHIPCRYDCAASIKIGKEIDILLKMYSPEIEKIVRHTLAKPILFFDLFKLVIFDGYFKEGILYYQKVLPPFFLLDKTLMAKIQNGNKIIASENQIEIFKNNSKLFVYKKKNKTDGFIINFEEYN